MEAIGFAVWRVLKKARQTAIKKAREDYAATLKTSRRSSAKASACVEPLATAPDRKQRASQ